jgi:hypothetical protein
VSELVLNFWIEGTRILADAIATPRKDSVLISGMTGGPRPVSVRDELLVVARPAECQRPRSEFPPPLSTLRPSSAKSVVGTTNPALYEDDAGGLYVGKPGKSPEHAAAEVTADSIYRVVDPNIAPESTIVTLDGVTMRLSKWVEGLELCDMSPEQVDAGLAAVSRHFGVDALLANRDVPSDGLHPLTNIKITPNGDAVRVDNGSALHFKAFFGMKRDFDGFPLDLWTLRDPKINGNRHSLKAFSRLTWTEITDQLRQIYLRRGRILEVTLPKDRPLIQARLEVYAFLVDATRTLVDQGVPPETADAFLRRCVEQARAGMELPKDSGSLMSRYKEF